VTSVESFKLGINFTNKMSSCSLFYKFARFYTVHAGGEGMNVIVRKDGGEFHVLGGGAGNETTHYEFEENARLTLVIMSIRFASPSVFAILHALFVDFLWPRSSL